MQKRRTIPKGVELDLDGPRLVVNYTEEVLMMDDEGTHIRDRQYRDGAKRVKLKGITAHTDIGELAGKIVEKLRPFLEEGAVTTIVRLLGDVQMQAIDAKEELLQRAMRRRAAEEEADPRRIDAYMEALYEDDNEQKAEGAVMILALARYSQTLETVLTHSTVIPALARVLNDEYKKSTELTTTIMEIFYCVSHYSNLHQDFLTTNRIGRTAMLICELEQKRYLARIEDMRRFADLHQRQRRWERARQTSQAAGQAAAEEEAAFRAEDAAMCKAVRDGETPAVSSLQILFGHKLQRHKRKKKKKLSRRQREAEEEEEAEMQAEVAALKLKLRQLPKGAVNINKERHKVRMLMRRQERLLFVCFHLLLNLASDIEVERKMCRKGLVRLLAPQLDRPNPQLLLLVVTFLMKLSIIVHNKDEMAARGVVPRLAKLVPCRDATLTSAVLRLLFNLSFDVDLCRIMCKLGVVKRTVGLLRHDALRGPALPLLYHLSIDDLAKQQMAEAGAIQPVLRMALGYAKPVLPPELAGLAVNMTVLPECAHVAAKPKAIHALLARVAKTGDSRLMKVVRNISEVTLAAQSQAWDSIEERRERWRAAKRRLVARAHRAEAALANQRADESDEEEDGGGKEQEDEEEAADAELAAAADPGGELEEGEQLDYEYEFEGLWGGEVRNVMRLLRTEDPALLVEVVGTVANWTPRDLPDNIDMNDVCSTDGMLPLVERCLTPGLAEDDIIMGMLQLVAAFALDEESAEPISKSQILPHIDQVLAHKASDLEMVCQATHAVHRLLWHEPTRAAIFQTRICSRLCAFLETDNDRLYEVVDSCLLTAQELDRGHGDGSAWREIQTVRFRCFNREWLAAASQSRRAMAAAGEDVGLHGGYDDEDEGEASGGFEWEGAAGGASPPQRGRFGREQVAVDLQLLHEQAAIDQEEEPEEEEEDDGYAGDGFNPTTYNQYYHQHAGGVGGGQDLTDGGEFGDDEGPDAWDAERGGEGMYWGQQ